jgi:hypothetical protein
VPPLQHDAIRCHFRLDGAHQGREEFASRWKCGTKTFYRCKDAGLRQVREQLREGGHDD